MRCTWKRQPEGAYYSPQARVYIHKCPGVPTHAKRVSRAGKVRWVRRLCAIHLPTKHEEKFTSLEEAKAWACERAQRRGR